MKNHFRRPLLAFLAALLVLSACQFPAQADTQKLTVAFLNVGQGDAEWIRLPNGQTMLIDAGNNGDGGNIVKYVQAQGCKKIDYLIETHPHADHIGGMAEVVNGIAVGAVYLPQVTTTTKSYENLLTAAERKKLTVKTAKAGVTILSANGVQARILAPNAGKYEELNDYSAVIKLIYQKNSFLFTGDAQGTSEDEMLAKGWNLKADVLKVGHHGSTTSTGAKFLQAVSPKYAVISVGKGNTYGHPAQATLTKLKGAGVTVYRTDTDGTVIVTSDGTRLTVSKSAFSTAGWLSGSAAPDGETASGSAQQSSVGTSGAAASGVVIRSVDKAKELVTLQNTSAKAVELKGWVLVSVTGNQRYTFPAYTLKANGTVTVASGSASGNLKWTASNVWNNSGSDPAQLYDAQGHLVSSLKA